MQTRMYANKDCDDQNGTLPETSNKSSENEWLEDEIPFGIAYFRGRTVSLRECNL